MTQPTDSERLLAEQFGIRRPPHLLTEDEAKTFDRSVRSSERRERLIGSPIMDCLGEGDARRVLEDRIHSTHALAVVKKWVTGWTGEARSVVRPWLILAGPTGVGKTIAAAWALAEVGGRYVRWPDVIADHRALGRRGSLREQEATRHELRARYGGAWLLILDELGIEGESDEERIAARTALHELVEMRQRWTHRTLVITNKSSGELAERFASGIYDPRTRSRLDRLLVLDREGAPLIAVDVKGDDLRYQEPTSAPRAKKRRR